MKKTLVIMAAGIGSRYGGGVKQLAAVGPNGEIIIDYSIYDALKVGFDKIVFIIRKDIEDDFREVIGNRIEKICDVEYAFQDKNDLPGGFSCPVDRTKPWGTGQAILACRGIVNEPFAVINADDYYGREAYERVFGFLDNADASSGSKHKMCLVGFEMMNTLSDNGGVTRGICRTSADNSLIGIDETKNIVKYNGGAAVQLSETEFKPVAADSLVSMNMWGFNASFIDYLEDSFKEFLGGLNSETELKSEFLVPIVVDSMLKKGIADVEVLRSSDQWFGVTYQEDKQTVIDAIADLIKKGYYPDKLQG